MARSPQPYHATPERRKEMTIMTTNDRYDPNGHDGSDASGDCDGCDTCN